MNTNQNYWKTRFKNWAGLDPPDRLSEVLFGLIMVLTFTGTISASTTGRQEVDELLWAALGCNFAWGLVDGIMYLMDTVISRSHDILQIKRIRQAKSIQESREIIKDNINPFMADIVNEEDIDKWGRKLKELPEPDFKSSLTFKDFLIGGQIFLLVFTSTFPVALPFIFISDVIIALRVSNMIGLVLLFAAGYSLAKYSGLKPLQTAMIYTLLGMILVSITLLLGG